MLQNLILWRHADAEYIDHTPSPISDMTSDLARPLSRKGHQQAKKMSQWLKHHLPHDTLIVSSPALRSKETTATLKREYLVAEAIEPEARLSDVLAFIEQMETENLLLVGHQPWLGQLISHLLDVRSESTTSIKKGALWWFKNSNLNPLDSIDRHTFKLISVQHPNLL